MSDALPLADTVGASERRATSADIARRAGVSVSAVSLALNGRAGVSEATRARIIAIADEMNWRPHRAARALKGAVNDVVGLVLARPAQTLGIEPFFANLLSGLQSTFSASGVAMQLLIVEDTAAEVEVYRRWAAEHRVGGVVLLDAVVDDIRPALLSTLGVPAVLLGGAGEPWPVANVWVDDQAAMEAIVAHLVAQGHRHIGHVSGPTRFLHSRSRAEALARLGACMQVVSVETDFSDAQGAAATRAILSGPARPSALVFDSDVMAVAGLGAAAELGVRVPEQLSIVSFDDSVLARVTHPSITSLTRDTYTLGSSVAQELLGMLANGGVPRAVQAPTPTLVVRGSTGTA